MQQSEFDKFAEEYQATLAKSITVSGEEPSFFHQYKVVTAFNIAKRANLHVERILDFGSGVGNSLPFFREHFPQSKLTCADVSTRSLEVSAARFPDVSDYLQISGPRLPAVDGRFDLVFSACVFHHIARIEHESWLTELQRVCRPSGMLIVFEHNPWNPLTLKVVHDCPFDRDANLISAPQFRRTLVRSGWHDAKITYTLFFPRSLAFLRNVERFLGFFPLGAQYAAIATAPPK
jgi:ubiquinone/menaquinone biosynthesis C-methylase UbiE